jgi:hypothetical protein
MHRELCRERMCRLFYEPSSDPVIVVLATADLIWGPRSCKDVRVFAGTPLENGKRVENRLYWWKKSNLQVNSLDLNTWNAKKGS